MASCRSFPGHRWVPIFDATITPCCAGHHWASVCHDGGWFPRRRKNSVSRRY